MGLVMDMENIDEFSENSRSKSIMEKMRNLSEAIAEDFSKSLSQDYYEEIDKEVLKKLRGLL
jgi:hypothetical protein